MKHSCPSVRFAAAFLFALSQGSALFGQSSPPASAGSQTPQAPAYRVENDARRGVIINDPHSPVYPVPYPPASVEEIRATLDRVLGYLETSTPVKMTDRKTGADITDLTKAPADAYIPRGDFFLVSYEWGVTYSGMLAAGEATGEKRYTDYAASRLRFIADASGLFREQVMKLPLPGQPRTPGQAPRSYDRTNPASLFRSVVRPHSLDDSGAMCAAMLRAQLLKVGGDLRPQIDNYMNWISTGQFRLPDGTLARNRPMKDTLWLDDLYMSVPALAQMGKLTGERRYYDDAVRQVLQFSERMFVREKGLYMHGWVQGMDFHPSYHWARANGWALMAMTELLDVLPEDHPGYQPVLAQYRAHVRGLLACQGSDGAWHQLLDRGDSYSETSATAIYVYCLARGINRGWLGALAHGPAASLGWNFVAKNVNEKGQVERTCVGTGMGFDPAFYYFRPVSPLAAHGYGPTLLAGAEMIRLRKGLGADAHVNDGATHFVTGAVSF